MINILIADDHQLFREGLKSIMSDDEEIEVVAVVADGAEAVKQAAVFNPDVVLMDVNMRGMGGLEATRELHSSHPQIRVLMLTVSDRDEDLFEAVRVGARGYLLKSASTDELLEGIRRVHAGEAIVAPSMAVKLLEAFATLSPALESDQRGENLTPREREVIQQVARGLTNKEIALELDISRHTVKTHLRRALDKLQLRSRTEAALWAARHRS